MHYQDYAADRVAHLHTEAPSRVRTSQLYRARSCRGLHPGSLHVELNLVETVRRRKSGHIRVPRRFISLLFNPHPNHLRGARAECVHLRCGSNRFPAAEVHGRDREPTGTGILRQSMYCTFRHRGYASSVFDAAGELSRRA